MKHIVQLVEAYARQFMLEQQGHKHEADQAYSALHAALVAHTQQIKNEAQFALDRLNHETNQKKYFQEVLRQIGDLAHDRSTGPAVPDTLWEIRQLAYDAFKEKHFN